MCFLLSFITLFTFTSIASIFNRSDILTQSGVTYEVVSNIPKASEELEDRESLAQIAASGEECSTVDGETYIGLHNFCDFRIKKKEII